MGLEQGVILTDEVLLAIRNLPPDITVAGFEPQEQREWEQWQQAADPEVVELVAYVISQQRSQSDERLPATQEEQEAWDIQNYLMAERAVAEAQLALMR